MPNDVMDATGGFEMVEALGQVWTFSHSTRAIRDTFSAWLKMRARKELHALRGGLTAAEFRDEQVTLGEEIAAGSYNWGFVLDPEGLGSAVRAALSQEEATLYLLSLLLRPHHGDVPGKTIVAMINERPGQVKLAILECIGMGVADEGPADPNAPKAPLEGQPTTAPTPTPTTPA